MGVMLHLAYQEKAGDGLHGMPSPVDGDESTPWPWEFWLGQMRVFIAHGGTVGVTPPLTKGASLGTGYDPFNHYDLGSNPHGPAGRRETRYGSVEGIASYVAQVRAMGAETYANVVHHHVDGDPGNWRYDYVAADGKTPGRFPKDIGCFWVWSGKHPTNPDAVFDPQWDLGFGREFKWNTGTYGDGEGADGAGYVRHGLAASLDWQTRRLGLDGYFLDDAKGTNAGYIGWLLQQGAMRDKVAFVELSDGNTGTLDYWMQLVNERAGVMDFALRYKIRDVCNSSADMRSILSEGVCWSNPLRAITFTNDIDLDLSDPIISRALLANALILGFPGYPMVFGKDVYPAPHGYGLGKPVMNLVWCHETFVKGELWWRATAADHLVWEMMGDDTSSGCLCCASIRDDWYEVSVQTKWPEGQQLHDYTGRAEDKWVGPGGVLTFFLPPDENGAGLGYVRYAVAGVENSIRLRPRRAVQTFFGAADLDTLPAVDGTVQAGLISPAPGSEVRLELSWGAPLPAGAKVSLVLVNEAGTELGDDRGAFTAGSGEHAVLLRCDGLPDEGLSYAITATYAGLEMP